MFMVPRCSGLQKKRELGWNSSSEGPSRNSRNLCEQRTKYLLLSLEAWTPVGGIAVPHFYFDVREGSKFTPDHGGLDFDSLDSAERAAAELAAEIGRDRLPKGEARAVMVEERASPAGADHQGIDGS